MTPTAFKRWLAAMKAAGLAKSDAEALRQLGFSSANTGTNIKRRGGDKVLALACTALLHRLPPFE